MLSVLHFVLAGLLAGSTFAQSNAGLPSCAASQCVTADYGGCESLDIECICTRGDWISGLACCVSEACDAAGQEATITFANAICGSVGEAGALPTTATCAAGQTPSLKSGSATASSTIIATATSSGASSITSVSASGSTTAFSNSTSTGTNTAATSASTTAATTSGDSGAYSLQAQGAGILLGLVGFLAAL